MFDAILEQNKEKIKCSEMEKCEKKNAKIFFPVINEDISSILT